MQITPRSSPTRNFSQQYASVKGLTTSFIKYLFRMIHFVSQKLLILESQRKWIYNSTDSAGSRLRLYSTVCTNWNVNADYLLILLLHLGVTWRLMWRNISFLKDLYFWQSIMQHFYLLPSNATISNDGFLRCVSLLNFN